MARRTVTNETGIRRIEGIPYHDAWVSYLCVKCKAINFVHIGQRLLTPAEALETCEWKCEHCGFIHSKQSDVPFENFDEEYRNSDSAAAHRFWEGFFRTATENPASYWKQCNVCTRILPFSAFSKHSGWGPLERQMECRSCKGVINAILNPKRTKEQMLESSVRRRIADIFLDGENETIDIKELFDRFDNKCFKTKIPLNINDRTSWAVDHILPSKFLYPLTKENAALLSKEANANKRDKWPGEFYTNNELIVLAKITGANLALISSPIPVVNHHIDVNRGVTRYLQVRETSGLAKRIQEIKNIVEAYGLADGLSPENKKLLGFL
jgi:DNA-directed RNA polymerase subunit RPC12/RpoP